MEPAQLAEPIVVLLEAIAVLAIAAAYVKVRTKKSELALNASLPDKPCTAVRSSGRPALDKLV